MIYEVSNSDDAIKQGDIFRDIPRVDLSLATMAVVDAEGQRAISWSDVVEEFAASPITALVAVRPVLGIVITQDCDTARGEFLCLSQLDDFLRSSGQSVPSSAKKWKDLLIKHSRTNLRLFYLPAEPQVGIETRMAADFRVLIRIPRVDLENMRGKRLCRLNALAKDHFRESLGQFFRRYAYNEWYPLTKEEFQAYSGDSSEEIKPYPWQE
jgi:hypothetical protein